MSLQVTPRSRSALANLRRWFSRRRWHACRATSWRIEGPFDSSYSLAIENRELALALAALGERVVLESRDGPGPFLPDADFLADNPRIAAMWQAGNGGRAAAVILRNTYPPFVTEMKGELRALACYGWEESGFPAEHVDAFNANLDLVTVLSHFVAKVLRDNGVSVPIRVVGCGIDQITRLERAKPTTCARQKFGLGDELCFLHISTCLPRKAVDVLLAAWARAFTRDDGVVLIIKATANQHHRIENDVAGLAAAHPHHARIVLINEQLPADDILALYRLADVVVCASRGEGFGLPLAEALALGKPVIATAYGGQIDFCSTENAWLCDYDFAYSRSHVATPGSIWAEPRLESLTDCLRQARAASPLERAQMGERGRAVVLSTYAWTQVAQRLQAAVAEIQATDRAAVRPPRIGWVSPWNTSGAIADHTRALACGLADARLVVFANRNVRPLAPDQAFVRRCWEGGGAHSFSALCRAIDDARVDALVVQFDFGLLGVDLLARLIDWTSEQGRVVYVFMHTTAPSSGDGSHALSEACASLKRARRVLVHAVEDLNHLKQIGIVDNVTLLPLPDGNPTPLASDPNSIPPLTEKGGATQTAAVYTWERLSARFDALICGEFLDDAAEGSKSGLR